MAAAGAAMTVAAIMTVAVATEELTEAAIMAAENVHVQERQYGRQKKM